jgi:hypothetical protein
MIPAKHIPLLSQSLSLQDTLKPNVVLNEIAVLMDSMVARSRFRGDLPTTIFGLAVLVEGKVTPRLPRGLIRTHYAVNVLHELLRILGVEERAIEKYHTHEAASAPHIAGRGSLGTQDHLGKRSRCVGSVCIDCHQVVQRTSGARMIFFRFLLSSHTSSSFVPAAETCLKYARTLSIAMQKRNVLSLRSFRTVPFSGISLASSKQASLTVPLRSM